MNTSLPKTIPQPLFDDASKLDEPSIKLSEYLNSTNLPEATQEYNLCKKFLESYNASYDTFTSYRREAEKFLHWSWLICHKSIKNIDRNDIRHYIEFVNKPPLHWIANKNAQRFIEKEGNKIPNPAWRPFVVKVSKLQRKSGKMPDQREYLLSNKSLAALLAIISTFFTFLQQENYVAVNPVQLVRQKSQYVQKQQSYKITRKLSHTQWQYVIEAVEEMAQQNNEFERHLFIISMFYLLGLRISELADTPKHTPIMGDFAPDKNDRWWLTAIGKGNKIRDVAMPDALLAALKRYRLSQNLSALPTRGETTPLLAKQRGHGNLKPRQIRNLVQYCFDRAITRLQEANKIDEAQDLAAATVHWLRHTAISEDVEHRPREHVRDDAGHESSVITDHYIDIDRAARHESARNKQLKPYLNSSE